MRKGNSYLKPVLAEAAKTCSNSKDSYLILKYKTPYYNFGPVYFDKINKQHFSLYPQKRLQNLGFKVTIETPEDAA